jgi:hypothetical protein
MTANLLSPIRFVRWEYGKGHFCNHSEQECLHGPHGASIELLKLLIPNFLKSYSDAGMEFKRSDVTEVTFGPFRGEEFWGGAPEEGYGCRDPYDEVRVEYWWGNSGLYYPATMEQWNAALSQVGWSRPRGMVGDDLGVTEWDVR